MIKLPPLPKGDRSMTYQNFVTSAQAVAMICLSAGQTHSEPVTSKSPSWCGKLRRRCATRLVRTPIAPDAKRF